MRVFNDANALFGRVAARFRRKRLERRLNEIAGHRTRRRPRLAVGGILAAVLAVGAFVVRRGHAGGLGPA